MILIRPPLEVLFDPGFWDEMLEAGINEVVVGYLALLQEVEEGGTELPGPTDARPRVLDFYRGKGPRFAHLPAVDPSQAFYDGLDVRPPERPPQMAPQAEKLAEAFRVARGKGITLYCFDDKGYFATRPGVGGGGAACWNDPETARYIAARTRDYARTFPEFSGVVLDGPDYKWEIAPGTRDDLFQGLCTCPACHSAAGAMGLELPDLESALDGFREELIGLTDRRAEEFLLTTRGLLGAADWWLSHPGLLDLLRFRYATIEAHQRAVYRGIKEHLPDFQVGVSSRTPAYSALTGHSLKRRNENMDFQLPKLYLWSGIQPGFRFVLRNYLTTLRDWGDGMSEEMATRLVEGVMGIRVPEGYPIRDFDSPAPRSFYDDIAGDEIRKMMAMVGDPERLVPFVGLEHFGGPQLTPEELRYLLQAMERNGVRRFIFYRYETMTEPVWQVLKEFSNGS